MEGRVGFLPVNNTQRLVARSIQEYDLPICGFQNSREVASTSALHHVWGTIHSHLLFLPLRYCKLGGREA